MRNLALLLALAAGILALVNAQDGQPNMDDFADFGGAEEEPQIEPLDDDSGEDFAEAAATGPLEPLEYKTPMPEGPYNFAEPFVDASVLGRKWVVSQSKKMEGDAEIAQYNGEWEVVEPEKVVLTNDFGLLAKNKARHHAVAAKLNKPFDFTKSRDFIMQYEVKYQEGQECGGGYVKLLSGEPDLKNFNDKTGYTIMFGPDKCGLTSKLHFIIRFKNPISGEINEHHAKQPEGVQMDSWFNDHKTHLYTLMIHDDNTYTIKVDQTRVASGDLLKDLEPAIQPPNQIADPNDRKPEDWDEREKIPDETAVKPDDWDETEPAEIEDEDATMPSGWLEVEPELIDDPAASKPDDWDAEMDGEWEAAKIQNPACESAPGCGVWKRPMKKNPKYKGKWKAPLISNPAYKGKWSARIIDNPAYFEADPYKMSSIGAIGIEMWTMSANILFDNFLITDKEEVAKKYTEKTFVVKHEQEELRDKSKSTNAVVGVMQSLVDAANDKPWLWAVYLLTVLIPIVLIAIFCTGGKDASADAKYAAAKKSDAPQPDDEDEEELLDDEEGGVEEIEAEPAPKSKGSPTKSVSSQGSRRSARKAAANTKDDLEDDEDEEEEEEESEEEEEEEEEEEIKPKPKSSPARRARARKD